VLLRRENVRDAGTVRLGHHVELGQEVLEPGPAPGMAHPIRHDVGAEGVDLPPEREDVRLHTALKLLEPGHLV
jgi:hypothetical protein